MLFTRDKKWIVSISFHPFTWILRYKASIHPFASIDSMICVGYYDFSLTALQPTEL
jgi:hypothetical protein